MPADVVESLVAELAEKERRNLLEFTYGGTAAEGHEGGPYRWQAEWHAAGKEKAERMIMAGNRTGKTRTVAAEVAMHTTGRYPRWWKGRRWDVPTSGIVSGPTNELTRDGPQVELFGKMREGERKPTGEGWVPAACIGNFGFRQCGIQDVLDSVQVRHVSGGWSDVSFKSYEQGPVKFQAVKLHWIWFDEEPSMEIYSEGLTRTLDEDGLVMFSRTPLFGATEVVQHFLDGGVGIFMVQATWDDAPHLSESAKERMYASFPHHERETRSKGVPMLGSGAVYPVPDELLECDPFPIPRHFRRIVGVDFGIDHPGAACWLAHDADADIIYVTDCYRMSGETTSYHTASVMGRGMWIPVSWPHDGLIRDKSGGIALCDDWRAKGVNMLGISARENEEKGGSQPLEPTTIEIMDRMNTGKIKVFRHLQEWFQEKRLYHRKDGKIVSLRDDIMDAMRYGVMMIRYAIPEPSTRRPGQSSQDWASYDALGAYRR